MRVNNQSDLDRRCTVPIFQFIILNPLSLTNTILCAICLTAIMYGYLTNNDIQHCLSDVQT